MSYSQDHSLKCSHPGCRAALRNSAWDQIKSDWFFKKTGEAYCPRHTPIWVEDWRAKQKEKKEKNSE